MIAPAVQKRMPSTRLSVSKADRDTEIGVELLSLLQTITEDGSISAEEIGALKEWLAENRHVDMPSIDFLSRTVDQIVADGIVTEGERELLYSCIEKVLPPDLRQYATFRRKAARAEEKRVVKERKAAEYERDRPIHWFDFMVAGVAYDDRRNTVKNYARDGMTAYLARDKANKHSRNAVAIFLQRGGMIGYVPETEAAEIAGHLDAGCKASLKVKRILTQTRAGYPIPIVTGEIYGPFAITPGALSQAETERLNVARPQAESWRQAFQQAEATSASHRQASMAVEEGSKSCLPVLLLICGVMAALFVGIYYIAQL